MNDQYPDYDENGKVVCKICGKSFITITGRHLKKHDVTMANYRLRYPDAPVTNETFKVKMRNKHKTTFQKEEEIDVRDIITDEGINDKIIDVDINELDEIKNTNTLNLDEEEEMSFRPQLVKSTDPFSAKKKLYNNLLMMFPNLQYNYKLRKDNIQGISEYEFITDFCDPVLRVVFFFPKTFWGNKDLVQRANKHELLKNDGWRVVEVNSNAPTIDDIISKL